MWQTTLYERNISSVLNCDHHWEYWCHTFSNLSLCNRWLLGCCLDTANHFLHLIINIKILFIPNSCLAWWMWVRSDLFEREQRTVTNALMDIMTPMKPVNSMLTLRLGQNKISFNFVQFLVNLFQISSTWKNHISWMSSEYNISNVVHDVQLERDSPSVLMSGVLFSERFRWHFWDLPLLKFQRESPWYLREFWLWQVPSWS